MLNKQHGGPSDGARAGHGASSSEQRGEPRATGHERGALRPPGGFPPRPARLKDGRVVLLRSASPSDASGIAEHMRSILQEGYFIQLPQEFTRSEEDLRRSIEGHERAEGKLCLVGVQASQVIGLLKITDKPWARLRHWGELELSIRQGRRGVGLGEQMLRAALDWARSASSLSTIRLSVMATNHAALGLYRKVGFVVEGTRSGAIKLGDGHHVDEIMMRVDLRDLRAPGPDGAPATTDQEGSWTVSP
ncbi:N-acetyltransferase family protein [Sorangium sp. So ce1024]|uniref:GNAT family N-acetyltransferase n=1 Tax=unclassified Sorangium TaxID=2621164 RepID=UPI003F0EA3EC